MRKIREVLRLKFDAGLSVRKMSIAAATRGVSSLRYDMQVADAVDGRRSARLVRNGSVKLEWDLLQTRIVSRSIYRHQDLRRDFANWAQRTLPEEECEMALALRRSVFISGGRGLNLDLVSHPEATGGCFTLQPQHVAKAVRVIGSTIDFTHHSELLTRAEDAWLAFT
ncbi:MULTISPECIES: hypothetical protein [unclassified Pseudomonas]|uniref:hypothetical protein n=1 Tax=unclassified Pseudomonas TaxID=196821 RepID=UPI0039B75B1F